jgi:hypothetical protein
MKLPEGAKPKIAIFTSDIDFANYKIDLCVENHNGDISKRVKSPTDSYAIMNDGTIYKWVRPSTQVRGDRFSGAIIDLATCDEDFIREYVLVKCIFAEKKDYVICDSKNTIDSELYDLDSLIDRLQKIRLVLGNIGKVGFSDAEYGWQPIDYFYVDIKRNNITFDTYC